MPMEDWIQHSTVARFLYDWQTVIAGVLALLAAFGTIVATMIIARRQIAASREEADRVIDATRAQTSVTAAQTETTVRLQRMRDAGEARAFRAMLEAAMTRVLAEATCDPADRDDEAPLMPAFTRAADTDEAGHAFQ
jgi:hypothetical protein